MMAPNNATVAVFLRLLPMVVFLAISTGRLDAEVIPELRARLESARIQAVKTNADARSLADIGSAQVAIDDLDGALRTIAAMSAGDRQSAFGADVLEHLVRSQVRQGDVDGAMDSLESFGSTSWLRIIRTIVSTAAETGKQERAKRICRETTDEIDADYDPLPRFLLLLEVARIQLAIDDKSGARRTLGVLEKIASEFTEDNGINDRNAKARALAGIGLVKSRTGDVKSGRDAFQRALQLTNLKCTDYKRIRRFIAVAQAEAGYVEDAIKTAKSIPLPTDRDDALNSLARSRALEDIATIQLSSGDLDGAYGTVMLLEYGDEDRDLLLLQIAKQRAEKRDLLRAINTVWFISNEIRRSQAALEVAAIAAAQGKKETAQTIARGLISPRVRWGRGFVSERAFDFEDLETWGLPYGKLRAFTISMHLRAEERAGDLVAAAMRCRVALQGAGNIKDSKMAEKWHVRKVAAAQASAGDAKGALAWADELSKPKRLPALLGIAEGLQKRRSRARK